MEAAAKKRIDQAWPGAKNWVADFTGAPTTALLVNVPADQVAPALAEMSAQVQNVRITTILADKPSEALFVEIGALPLQVEQLFSGKLAELSVNWAVQQEAFDLDIHLVIHPLTAAQQSRAGENPEAEKRLVSLQLDWWSDQVFSEETDNQAQFTALASYFIDLQAIFQATNLFLSAEGGLDPGAENDDWVEI